FCWMFPGSRSEGVAGSQGLLYRLRGVPYNGRIRPGPFSRSGKRRRGMSEAARLLIHIDGAARGNPGPAAFAYVIAREGHPVFEHAECMGEATNNVAEYTALVRALER